MKLILTPGKELLLMFAQISKLHNLHQERRLGSVLVYVALVSSLSG
jgi:hypothetical protein